jgi:hypothetical protein
LATRLYGCYRKEEAASAETMLDAAAIVLATYPDEIMETVTHPVRGLPGRMKWPPNIAEIREACEELMAPIRREAERRSQIERQRRLIEGDRGSRITNEQRMTAEEMEARYGKDYGLGHRLPLPDQCMKNGRAAVDKFKVPTWDDIMDGGGSIIPCSRRLPADTENGEAA